MATAKLYNEPSTYPIQKEDKNKVVYAAIYTRVSSPNQVKEYSLEEQERRCQERCDLMGWRVRYIFREEGASGATLNRPKFQTMLEKARMERFDILVFWKLDRFCRSLVDLVNIERELRECGISLHSVTEQIDTTTPVGKFNFRNLASAAELERDLIKERAKMGMHALARQHKWPNKNPPLGYDKMKDARLKINGEEAELVRTIFIMYRDSKSMPEVAYRLNEKGMRNLILHSSYSFRYSNIRKSLLPLFWVIWISPPNVDVSYHLGMSGFPPALFHGGVSPQSLPLPS